jgi:DNA/RNA endonuclease YhcR with UshA esterase domain
MRAKITSAFLVFAISICGQQAKEYSAAEAGKHVGETAPVTDKAANVFESKAGNIFLNFGARYLNQLFTAYISKDSADQFSNANKLNDETVSITGKIVLYKGNPEIVVDTPSQIKKTD